MKRILICSLVFLAALLASCTTGEAERTKRSATMPLIASLSDVQKYNGRRCLAFGRIERGDAKNDTYFISQFGRVRITDDVPDRFVDNNGIAGDKKYIVTARYIEKRAGDHRNVGSIDFFDGNVSLHYFTDITLIAAD